MAMCTRDRTASAIVDKLRTAGCVFAEDEARMLVSAAQSPAELAAIVDQRVAGLPLEHVIGWAEFRGLRIAVDPGVFVPRRRTEFLVDMVAAVARPPIVVVDLCCGSGSVGVALGEELECAELHAVDVDPAAVRCARRNLSRLNARVYEGDLYEPLPDTLRGRVDILVVNAPYVPSAAIGLLPPEARIHEPRWALDGGEDGLEVLRRVIADARRWLAPAGHLLLETSDGQALEAVRTLTRGGFVARQASSEEFNATVVIGTPAQQQEAWSSL